MHAERNPDADALIPQEGRNPGNYHVGQERVQIDRLANQNLALKYESLVKKKLAKESKPEDRLVPKLEYERKVLNKLQKQTEKCKNRRNNIFFLKVHKSGSATVQNILLRFGRPSLSLL